MAKYVQHKFLHLVFQILTFSNYFPSNLSKTTQRLRLLFEICLNMLKILKEVQIKWFIYSLVLETYFHLTLTLRFFFFFRTFQTWHFSTKCLRIKVRLYMQYFLPLKVLKYFSYFLVLGISTSSKVLRLNFVFK